jgi:hypothetical protein
MVWMVHGPDARTQWSKKRCGVLSCMSFVVFLTLMVSCTDKTLIPEDEFVSILTDMYLSKSYFYAEGINEAYWMDTIPYNHHIVEQHGYEWAHFDSTVSWYCSRPKQYQDVYDEVIARLNEIDQMVSQELDPPSELWAEANRKYLPADGKQDSVPVNILLKGEGIYVASAKIRVYSGDRSLNPRIALYLWHSDTTAQGVRDTFWIRPVRKDGLMFEYTMEKTLLPGNVFTHIKGSWLQHDENNMDTAWYKRAEIMDISVYHIPKNFNTTPK